MIGDPEALAFLYSGGMKVDLPFTPQHLYEVAKMDGAIIVNSAVTKIAYVNVQLMPDPTIESRRPARGTVRPSASPSRRRRS